MNHDTLYFILMIEYIVLYINIIIIIIIIIINVY